MALVRGVAALAGTTELGTWVLSVPLPAVKTCKLDASKGSPLASVMPASNWACVRVRAVSSVPLLKTKAVATGALLAGVKYTVAASSGPSFSASLARSV